MPVFTSNIELSDDYPSVEPSLKLNFARSRTLDPRVTFSRTHDAGVVAATYVGRDGQVKRAIAGEPRFDHDYSTGESLGLLIEDTRINYCGDAIPSAADWTALNGGTITSTTEVAPDGTNTAFRYQGSSASPASLLRVGLPAFTTGTDVYTVSFYVKQVVANTQAGQNLICDLQDGGPSVNYSDQLVQDKWVRVVQTGTTVSGNKTFFDVVTNTLNDGTYDFWGLQIEEGDFATSLILTTDSTIGTRGPDQAYIDDVNTQDWYSIPEGTVCFEHTTVPQGPNTNPGYPAVGFAQANTGDSATAIQYYFTKDNNNADYLVRNGSGGGANDIAVINTTNALESNRNLGAKVAFVYKKDDYALARSGLLMGTDTSGDVPTAGDGPYMLILGLNALAVATNHINAHIKYLHYYPKRLTNAQLLTITS